jgi:hypothetical protein
MPLFLDRLPLHQWTDPTQVPPLTYWSVLFPALLTDPGLSAPPPGLSIGEWVCDTGNTGEAFAWRQHLLQAGLDPDVRRLPGHVRVAGSIAPQPGRAALREADLWLLSNIPALSGSPHRLRLERGLRFLDITNLPDPRYNRPLIGTRALRRAGLRIDVDFANDHVSVWTPDPPPTP